MHGIELILLGISQMANHMLLGTTLGYIRRRIRILCVEFVEWQNPCQPMIELHRVLVNVVLLESLGQEKPGINENQNQNNNQS